MTKKAWVAAVATALSFGGAMLYNATQPPENVGQKEIWKIYHYLPGDVQIICTAQPEGDHCPLCTGTTLVRIDKYGQRHKLDSDCRILGKPPSTAKTDIDLKKEDQ